jgi:ribosomal protein L7Ae-like RNA K-turn-binding protein
MLLPEGGVIADVAGKSFGRGAWLHARPACLSRAPRALSKALRAPVSVSASELTHAIQVAADRRVRGLMAGAAGAKKLAIGATAVKEELEAGRVALVVVAKDARAAVESREVATAIKNGLAVAWGSKLELGALCHRQDLGVVGVLDGGLARALRRAVELAHTPALSVDGSAEGRAFAEEG